MADSKRIEAVDVLRGMTMAFMILVNNAGDWAHVYAPLQHAEWNGMTPTDCIFPVFLFLMGYSIYLSLRKSEFRLSGKLWGRILKRFVLLFGIGVLLFLPMGLLQGSVHILGVLQRFAICYLVVTPLVCLVPRKALPWIAASLLMLYWVLLAVGHGFAEDGSSILSKVDHALLGSHINEDHGVDPEGVLSSITAIAHTLIGYCAAWWAMEAPSREEGIRRLLILGSILLLGGLVLQYGCPLNKKIWSPTFVMATCGVGCLLLGLFTWLIDEKKYWKQIGFWKVFGTNSILCYILSFVLLYAFLFISIGGKNINAWLNTGLTALVGPGCLESLLYALVIVLLVWLMVFPLYKKRIFIKL